MFLAYVDNVSFNFNLKDIKDDIGIQLIKYNIRSVIKIKY